MADLFTWISGFLTMDVATIGTTDITLGLMLALSLIAGVALSVIKKAKGRG